MSVVFTDASFLIDHGVSLWQRRGGVKREEQIRWPFVDLGVGDSFFVPLTVMRTAGVSSSACEYARTRPEITFETRSTNEDPVYHVPGTRVWRTA